jgi:glycosyltransferase involved in cell wall biosynthesis
MRHVLLIAYYFPPVGGAGTQRPAKFAKYLGEFGWRTTVLTRPARPQERDDSLLADVPASVKVERVEPAEGPPGWASSLPQIDCASGWLEPAFERACRLARQDRFDAILVTMSPFDLGFLGERLAQTLDVPLVVDLRDPWALDGWRVQPSRRRHWQDMRAMKQVLEAANGVIMNTPEARRAVLSGFPGLDTLQVIALPNGYDAADFDHPALPPDAPDPEVFCLVHTGTLHTRWLQTYAGPVGCLRRWRHYRAEPLRIDGRTEVHLLSALRQLVAARHPMMRRFELVLAGPEDVHTRKNVESSGLGDRVRITGCLAHERSIGWLHRADALFLPLHGLPPGRRSLIVPGKTYEYLASGRPILGCLPDGDARDLVLRSGRGHLADPCDAASIAKALADLYEYRKQEISGSCLPPWLAHYERRHLTRQLATFLQDVSGARSVNVSATRSFAVA